MTDAARDPRGGPDHPAPWTSICPYLLDATGRWRALTPATEHRCTAVRPPVPLRAEKQRRLCMQAGHVECPTYVAAHEVRAASLSAPPRAATFASSRTAPVVLERPGPIAVAVAHLRAALPQLGVALVVLLAAAALILARLVGP